MHRAHTNRIPGRECIHVELTVADIDTILGDDFGDPLYPATKALRRILTEASAEFYRATLATPAPEGAP